MRHSRKQVSFLAINTTELFRVTHEGLNQAAAFIGDHS